jgi:hypothetical protein
VLAATDTLVIDDRVANAHLVKRLRTSTQLQIDFLNERIDNNASFNQLRPAYQPQLNFSLVQPLLRNFGWDFTYLVVRVAEQTADAARFQYEADLADFVAEISSPTGASSRHARTWKCSANRWRWPSAR